MSEKKHNSVYTIGELNLEKCTFSKPEKFDCYHESFINVNGSRGFILQSPRLILRNSTSSYFEFLVSRNKDQHREFYNIITLLEDTAILNISNNSKEWFNREIKLEQVNTMFRSVMHRPLDINDSFILRINKIHGLEAEVNTLATCLLKIDGILFGKNTSTLDIKVIKIKTFKSEKMPSDDYVEKPSVVKNPKPFYNDNASVVPSTFIDQKNISRKKQLSEIEQMEKLIEKNNMTQQETNVPAVEEPVVKVAEETVPEPVQVVEEQVKEVEEPVKVVGEPVSEPVVEEQVKVVDEPVPEPVVEEQVKVVEEPVPEPVVEESVPVVEEPVTVVEEPVTVVEEPVPVVEEPVPVVEEPVPVVEESVQVVEETLESKKEKLKMELMEAIVVSDYKRARELKIELEKLE